MFVKPRGNLERIVSLRLTQPDIDMINKLIEREDKDASTIIRLAVREYAQKSRAA